MATVKTLIKKISRTSKSRTDNSTVFHGSVVPSTTKKTTH